MWGVYLTNCFQGNSLGTGLRQQPGPEGRPGPESPLFSVSMHRCALHRCICAALLTFDVSMVLQ